jgi:hypothetical protein
MNNEIKSKKYFNKRAKEKTLKIKMNKD